MHNSPPNSAAIVLTIAAHDPTGGAGVQADIESIIANGCVPMSIITALTEQSLSYGVKSITTQTAEQFARQLNSVIQEFSIAAIKIGVIASRQILQEIIAVLEQLQQVPVIFDPVIAASSGYNFCPTQLLPDMQQQLLGRCTLITPNKHEALVLSGKNETASAAKQLLDSGCRHVLITGVENNTSSVKHRLFSDNNQYNYQYSKLDGEYHGSGCTLSAAIAAQIALGLPIERAVKNALDFTWHCLENALIQQNHNFLPNRFYSR